MSVQTFLQGPAFNSFGYILSGRISGSYVNSFFKRTAIVFSTVAIKLYIPTNSPQRSNFCSFSPTLIFFLKIINKVMRVWLTYNVVLVSAVQQSETVIYTFPLLFRFFSYIGHCRVLSKVPCAIQQILISYATDPYQLYNRSFLVSVYIHGATRATLSVLCISAEGSLRV